MTLLTACANRQTVSVIGECSWTRYFVLEDHQIEPLVECCRNVAEEVFAHNQAREEFCG